MSSKKNRKVCKRLSVGPEYEHYTQFKEVHLVSNGILTMCKATTIDGVEEFYSWDNPKHRDLVRKNCIKDVNIIEGPNLSKGWNYGIN